MKPLNQAMAEALRPVKEAREASKIRLDWMNSYAAFRLSAENMDTYSRKLY